MGEPRNAPSIRFISSKNDHEKHTSLLGSVNISRKPLLLDLAHLFTDIAIMFALA